MKEYSTPQVTIDLEEYNYLLSLRKTIAQDRYKLALETLLDRLSAKGMKYQDVYPEIGEALKAHGISGRLDGHTYKLNDPKPSTP